MIMYNYNKPITNTCVEKRSKSSNTLGPSGQYKSLTLLSVVVKLPYGLWKE